jgi:asparagine synthase (glutamine-hydrolysing)
VCGIAGIVDFTGSSTEAFPDVDPLLGLLRHRGPDSSGSFVRPGAAIGQTRLAVIDLVTGDPPIANEDGTVGVAFNGEIYNFRSLLSELARAGHTLKTEGDTEVIAHLAEDLDPVSLALRLDGMFAFAVWDDRRRRLVLGRDRFGKKPLYYWTDGRRLVFGSEIKAVLAAPCVPRRMEPSALPAYLTFGYVPTPRTFFEGVQSLPPGHVLSFSAAEGVVVVPYWEPPVPGLRGVRPLELRGEELRQEVRRRLCDAVERRLVSDVPLGAFLSGGVDSSAVVALMARLSPRRVRTFTIGFDDQDLYDERPYAALVARLYGTEHTEFVVDPDRAELIDRLVWHHDQPFGDSSALPTFLLSELTRKHVTVALCGDGGDEMFGGYERFAAALALSRLDRLPVSRIPQLPIGGRGASVHRALSRAGMGMPDAYLSWLTFAPSALAMSDDRWGIDDYRRIWQSSEGAASLERLVNLNIRTYLLDDLLVKVDRASMAHGLEVRSPFLDADLADLALRLPPRSRVWGFSLKRALKDAVRDLLPREILHRRKRGFGVPLDRWFRTDLASYVQGTLCSSSSRINNHLHADQVAALVAEHQSGTANHGHALWTLLTLEVFLRAQDW